MCFLPAALSKADGPVRREESAMQTEMSGTDQITSRRMSGDDRKWKTDVSAALRRGSIVSVKRKGHFKI